MSLEELANRAIKKRDDEIVFLRSQIKILVEALEKIGSVQLDPGLGQIVGSEHYEGAWLECIELAHGALQTFKEAVSKEKVE
jgi:hypothetical protein